MKAFIRKHPGALAAACLLILFLLGLFCAGGYGIYIDQQSEIAILRENLKEYAVHLSGEGSEAALYYDRIGLPRITETAEIDHGISAFYPLAPFATRMDTDPASLFPLWNGLCWCWFMAGVAALYCLCRRLGMSRVAALAGAMLLYLSPRFFAEGHYNNKDVVLLSLCLLTMLSGVRLWEKPTLCRGAVFALAGALCANTKIIGLCVFGVMGLAALLHLTAQRRWSRSAVAAAVGTVLCFLLFYWLLTPAMWQDPAGYFRYVFLNATGFTRWDNSILFRGAVFKHSIAPLPFYYLPYMMLTTLPVYVTCLCALGQLTAVGCWVKQRKQLLSDPVSLLLLSATLLWAAPLGYAMVSNPVVYNGWRHFYFVFAGLSVLGAWGLEGLIRFFRTHGKRWQQWAAAGLAGLCLATSALGILLNHPHQYAYYNALGRWLCPAPIEEGMELDYWCVSLIDGLEQALKAEPAEASLTCGALDPVTRLALSYYTEALPPSLAGRLTLAPEDALTPDLLVVNRTYQHLYGSPLPEGYQPVAEVHSYGSTLTQVYRRLP